MAVEDVGEVAFEGAASFSRGLAFADLAFQESLGLRVVALLNDGDAVERGVELAVAAAVQAMSSCGLSEPQGMGAAPQKRANAPASRKRRTSPAWATMTAARLLPTP